MTEMDLTFL